MTQNALPLTSNVSAITIFVSDLARARCFYERFLRLRPAYQDDESTAYQISDTVINLLKHEAVPELVHPREMAREGLRTVYTLPVTDVDTAVAELADVDISPISGPMDRPWGLRTANFVDPDGYVWELSCAID